ncbi:MAG: CHAT domain-containing protein, partial [Bacteroidales bacterium]|nr:CHAT domain-containing protein [Bacteroidales bacterium]
ILTAYEISKLDLHNVNLVVLSACETGLGDDLFDGIFGLQRAFKKAGAGAILMSLWQIDDKATSEYMSLFYEKLVEGYSKHDAYISTVLSMKEKYPDATYWASFVLLD